MASLISLIKERNRTTPTWLKILIPFLGLGGLGVVALLAAIVAFIVTAWLGQPIPVLGFDQTFEQPIAFPHTVHAGTDQLLDASGAPRVNQDGEPLMALGLDCTFCHRNVTTLNVEENAGVPPVEQCAFCHQVIGPDSSVGLTTLREDAGIIGNSPQPINWLRVHRLPDHVRFIHEPHIRFLTSNPSAIMNATDSSLLSMDSVEASQVCSTCHGNVAAMQQVEQVEPLKMGFCLDCHRKNGGPTDCAVCHH